MPRGKPKQKKVTIDLQHVLTNMHVHNKPIDVQDMVIESVKMDLADFEVISNEPLMPKIEDKDIELDPNDIEGNIDDAEEGIDKDENAL